MNKREYVVILIVNILLINSTLGERKGGFSLHFPRRHCPPKLKEHRSNLNNVEESVDPALGNNNQDDADDDSIELPESDEDDAGLQENEEKVDEHHGEEKDKRQNLRGRPSIHHDNSRKRDDELHEKVAMEEDESIDDNGTEEDESPDTDEDYIKEVSYDPNIPLSFKKNDRTKRLISSQESENKMLDDESDRGVVESMDNEDDLYNELLLNEDSSETTSNVQGAKVAGNNKEKRVVQPVLSATTALSIQKSMDTNGAGLSHPLDLAALTDEHNDLLSKILKKANEMSALKDTDSKGRQTPNGPSQGFKNIIELNKAFKLLVCAANRFVKIANKTLLDRMLEECATLNSTSKTTTDPCLTTSKSQTTSNGNGQTTDQFGVDCCSKSLSTTATKKSSDFKSEDLDDSLVEELLDITIKPKKKAGNSQRKEVLSLMENNGNKAYDSYPDLGMMSDRGDPSIYVYGDYDSADDDDDSAQSTDSRRGSSASTKASNSIKASSRSFELSSSKSNLSPLKSDSDALISKAVLATRGSSVAHSQSTSLPLEAGSSSASPESASPREQATPNASAGYSRGRHKQLHAGRIRLSRKFKPLVNMRRSRHNKRLLPMSFLRSAGPEDVSVDIVKKVLEGPTTLQSLNAAESNVAPLPDEADELPRSI